MTTTKPAAFQRATFDAFRMAGGKALPITVDAANLDRAVVLAAASCQHREFFVVRETDQIADRMTLHWYTVKRKSTARYTVVDHIPRKVHDLYAEHLFDVEVAAFDPVQPWSWSPGADVVGADRAVFA